MENKSLLLFFINAKKDYSLVETHPNKDSLYDQVVDGHMDEKVMNHVGNCPCCSKELLNIMIDDEKVTDELIQWANDV